jgi:hypothetical protein
MFERRRAMKRILIVYHTLTGGTQQMAQATAAGAAQASSLAVCLELASDSGPEALLAASGYVFACPQKSCGDVWLDEGLLCSVLLPSARSVARPALRNVDLCRQRRKQRGARDRSRRGLTDRPAMPSGSTGSKAPHACLGPNWRGPPTQLMKSACRSSMRIGALQWRFSSAPSVAPPERLRTDPRGTCQSI